MRTNSIPKQLARKFEGRPARGLRRTAVHAVQRAAFEALEARRLLSFAPAATYPVDTDPRAVATADLNGDGRLDLVTANHGGNSVSILLGNADGTFQPALNSTASANSLLGPNSVSVGDVNADGKPDVVTVNVDGSGFNDEISVLLGNGNGTFQTPRTVVLPDQVMPGYEEYGAQEQYNVSVAVGDLNRDGTLDLAATAQTLLVVTTYPDPYYGQMEWIEDGWVNVLLGTGGGDFADSQVTHQDTPVRGAALADFNGDNHLDLLTSYSGVHVLPGNGDGTLQAPVVTNGYYGFGPGTLPIGDFDEDGRLDILARDGNGSVVVLQGQGNGAFHGGQAISLNGALAAVVGDVDADGNLDVVITTSDTQFGYYGYYGAYDPTSTDHATVVLGHGDGSFAAPVTSTLGTHDGYDGVSAAVLGDFNGNARPDLAATGPYGLVSVALNDGNWAAPPSITVGDVTVAEGDAGTTNAVFTVTLGAGATQNVTVNYSSAGGTAVSGRDFDAITGTLTFAPGETSKTISVAVRGDLIDEYDEAFYVNLSGAAGALIADGRGVGTITDNDPPPTISIANASQSEGHKGSAPLTFTISLSAASEKDISLNFATADGTATTADNDYVGTSGSVSIAAGQTSGSLSVFIVGDKRKESNETFFVNLSGAVNAVFADGQAIGTILNDDGGGGGGKGSGRVK